MTPIHRQPIDHPSAWTSKSLGGKEALVVRLGAAELDAIDGLLAKTAKLAPQQVTRTDFDHPAVNAFLADIYERLTKGRGTVIIAGLTPERYSEDDFERIYWGFGTHWGMAVMQNKFGDRLGHVRKEKNNPTNRGYIGDQELTPHSDPFPIIGLMCVSRAETGGESRLVSGLAIHNEILRTRPDLLEALYRGHIYSAPDSQGLASPVTDYSIPVYSTVGDTVSNMLNRNSMERAATHLGKPFPADFLEALDYLRELTLNDDFRLRVTLEPGEMVIINNFTAFHARSQFQDSDRNKRHLLRLWLKAPNARPVVPELLKYGATYERLYEENRETRPAPAPATA